MIYADVTVFNSQVPDKSNVDQLDTKVKLTMGRAKIVFLNKFVSTFLVSAISSGIRLFVCS